MQVIDPLDPQVVMKRALVMLLCWEWPLWAVISFWLPFTFITGTYLSSNLFKVPSGAYFS